MHAELREMRAERRDPGPPPPAEATEGKRANPAPDNDQPPPPDPVEATIRLVEGAVMMVKLIRHLAAQPDRKSHVDTIAAGVYKKTQTYNRRRTVRKLVERTRDRLKGKAPCQIDILDNVVELRIVC
jgi:hypothetical protein